MYQTVLPPSRTHRVPADPDGSVQYTWRQTSLGVDACLASISNNDKEATNQAVNAADDEASARAAAVTEAAKREQEKLQIKRNDIIATLQQQGQEINMRASQRIEEAEEVIKKAKLEREAADQAAKQAKEKQDAANEASARAAADIEATKREREKLRIERNEINATLQQREQEIKFDREAADQATKQAKVVQDAANEASAQAATDIEAAKIEREKLQMERNEAAATLLQREHEINRRTAEAEGVIKKAMLDCEDADQAAKQAKEKQNAANEASARAATDIEAVEREREKLRMENTTLIQRLEKVNEVTDILPILECTGLPPQKKAKRKGATVEDLDKVMQKIQEAIEGDVCDNAAD